MKWNNKFTYPKYSKSNEDGFRKKHLWNFGKKELVLKRQIKLN